MSQKEHERLHRRALRCNLSCSFCDTTYRHQKSEDELSLEEWLLLIDQAVESGVQQFFVLGGGEPFVKKGIIDILQAIKSHNCYGMLTTNGSLIAIREPLVVSIP